MSFLTLSCVIFIVQSLLYKNYHQRIVISDTLVNFLSLQIIAVNSYSIEVPNVKSVTIFFHVNSIYFICLFSTKSINYISRITILFSYLFVAKKGPSPKPRQPASGEPTSNPQDQQQKKDQETKPNPREQQQKPNTKPTPAQQQQQQNQPASALQQKEQAQHMPAQKQPPTSNSTPNQSAPENPKKSKSCAII